MVSVADVAPVIGVPLRIHWYVSDPPPAAVTLKDACCSSMTVRLAGCTVIEGVVIVGAVTTKVGVEAGVDAGVEAGVDAGIDAGVEAGVDAGVDAGVGAGIDAEGDVLLPVPSLLLSLLPQPTNGSTTNDAASPMRLVSCIDRLKVGTAFLRNLRFFFIII